MVIGWPENKDQILQEMRTYLTFWDGMVVIDRIIMKGRNVIIPELLKSQAVD